VRQHGAQYGASVAIFAVKKGFCSGLISYFTLLPRTDNDSHCQTLSKSAMRPWIARHLHLLCGFGEVLEGRVGLQADSTISPKCRGIAQKYRKE
jgi:hypothetical protein